jgi:hypothetical protein
MKKIPSLLFLLILGFGNCFSQQKQNPIQGFQSPLNTKAISNSSNLLTPTNGSKNKGRVETYSNHFLHKLNGSLSKEQ